jgi:hypothetical protein
VEGKNEGLKQVETALLCQVFSVTARFYLYTAMIQTKGTLQTDPIEVICFESWMALIYPPHNNIQYLRTEETHANI